MHITLTQSNLAIVCANLEQRAEWYSARADRVGDSLRAAEYRRIAGVLADTARRGRASGRRNIEDAAPLDDRTRGLGRAQLALLELAELAGDAIPVHWRERRAAQALVDRQLVEPTHNWKGTLTQIKLNT